MPTRARFASFRLIRNLIGIVALLAALAGWAVGYRVTNRMAESANRAALSQDVIGTIRGVVAALSRASAAARDSTSSIDQRLSEFQRASDNYYAGMSRLHELMSGDPAQLDSLKELNDVVMARLAALKSAVGGNSPLPSSGPASIPLVTAIDGPLGELEAREQALAEARARDARAIARLATVVQALNAFVTILTFVGAFLLFNRDTTRREADEARLREALATADAANEAKTTFLATVSHEIRTPLTAVSGMSELLLETRLDPEQTEFARAVHNNSEALAMLIGDLLDSSRIEAGQVFLEPAPFDLREMVESVAELLVVRAEAKGVDVIVDMPPAMSSRVIGDRMRLRQVVMNLVGNAVKFTERGEITIRARVEPAADGLVRVTLAVIDTGIGIPVEAQHRIFERFVQADRSTARRYGGTGLGLNISRSLIELMKGRLSLHSEPGHGSTFTAEVMLPLAPAQPAPEIAPASLAGIDVLLVQPNASMRGLNEQLLQFAGATVRAVETAAEAMALVAERVPQVMVADERLPDSSGIDLAARAWHSRDATTAAANVVLLCSLRARAADSIGSYGLTACVYKPVKQARLIQAVREAAGWAVEPVARPAAEQASDTRPRVLLVEDNRDNWVRASRILTESGHDVDRAENGVDAVAMATARDYDLVLMDVALPQMDGIEATRRIRAHGAARGRRVPIVALTAHAMDSVRQQALAAGMDSYVTKPYEKQQLLDICAAWIDRRPLLLVADDTADNRLLLANYLRGGNYRLDLVVNGQEAVEAFERRRPALVLLDMEMPIMSGYDAARTIRSLPGGEAVPIIALTAHDGPQERERCLSAGCSEFLTKPLRRSDILARIAALLGGAYRPAPLEAWVAPRADFNTHPSVPGVGDALAHLATLVLGVPSAVITLNAAQRVQVAGAAGLPASLDVSPGFPRDKSLTRLIVDEQRSLIVEDARSDPRVSNALLVASYGLVAVAGVPLTNTTGAIVGAFLALEDRPRRWPAREIALLEQLAAVAARLLAVNVSTSPSTSSVIGDEVLVVDNDIIDLVPNYVASRRQDVTVLREWMAKGDLDAIARLAHQMKGSGAGYGLPFVTHLGRAIEDTARAGDAAAIPPMINDLDRQLTRLRIRSADGQVTMEL